MAPTVTATQLNDVLEDYKIHLTGYDASAESASTTATPRAVSNPPNWPTDRRRVPDYRPIDRNRDAEGRPNGSVLPERIFLTLMFTGVVTNAVSRVSSSSRTNIDISIDNCEGLGCYSWAVLSRVVQVCDRRRVVIEEKVVVTGKIGLS